MADFIPVTASNQPRLHDHEAVEKIIQGYYVDPDLELGVGIDSQRGAVFLYVYGFAWPEAWKLPDGVSRDDFDPNDEDEYEKGADGFLQLLRDLAPHLAEPLTVQAIGSEQCRFPLSACEWHLRPGDTDVTINEFQQGWPETATANP